MDNVGNRSSVVIHNHQPPPPITLFFQSKIIRKQLYQFIEHLLGIGAIGRQGKLPPRARAQREQLQHAAGVRLILAGVNNDLRPRTLHRLGDDQGRARVQAGRALDDDVASGSMVVHGQFLEPTAGRQPVSQDRRKPA